MDTTFVCFNISFESLLLLLYVPQHVTMETWLLSSHSFQFFCSFLSALLCLFSSLSLSLSHFGIILSPVFSSPTPFLLPRRTANPSQADYPIRRFPFLLCVLVCLNRSNPIDLEWLYSSNINTLQL